MRVALALSLALLMWAPARAGELIFANGSRLAGDLSSEALMVSTGSGLVEITPDEVVTLSREEIRLRDGRVIRGVLVGDHVKARTSLGEIAVKVDELQTYRATGEPGAGAATAAASPPPASPGASVTSAPSAATPARNDTGVVGGLPTVAAYQDPKSGRQGNGTATAAVQTAALTPESQMTPASRIVRGRRRKRAVPGRPLQLVPCRSRGGGAAGAVRRLDRPPPADPQPASVRRRPLGEDPLVRRHRGLGSGRYRARGAVSGFRAWLAELPAGIRWTLLAVGAVLLVTLVAGAVSSWLGHREAVAQRAFGPALATAQRALGSGQPADLDAAAATLRQFLSSHPRAKGSAQAWYVLGQVEFRRSQWDPAIAAFAEASRRDRGSIGSLSRLGQGYAHEAKGDAARALEVYQQALSGLSPKDFLYGDLLLAKARAQELAKDSAGAIASYKQYLKDLPSADRVQDVRIRLALLGSAG